jgi:hypothetical protein
MFGSDLTATAALGIIAIDVGLGAGDSQVVQDHPAAALKGASRRAAARHRRPWLQAARSTARRRRYSAWVAFPAGAVVEHDRQQPLAVHMLVAAMAAAGAQVVIQVGGGLGYAGVVAGQHRPAGRGIAEAVEDRDALGGAQDDVEGGHGVAAVRAAEQLPGAGVAALEHAWNSATDASPCRPKLLAPAPYQRPGDSP